MEWRIAQEAEHQWTVYRGSEKHWTQTAQAAVELKYWLELGRGKA